MFYLLSRSTDDVDDQPAVSVPGHTVPWWRRLTLAELLQISRNTRARGAKECCMRFRCTCGLLPTIMDTECKEVYTRCTQTHARTRTLSLAHTYTHTRTAACCATFEAVRLKLNSFVHWRALLYMKRTGRFSLPSLPTPCVCLMRSRAYRMHLQQRPHSRPDYQTPRWNEY